MAQHREDKVNRTQVLITLADGSVLTASIRMSLSNRLNDTLNNPEPFLDAVTATGQQIFVAKASIRTVRSAAAPKADQLDDTRLTGFDPYAVLKIERGAGPEEIKQAYHRMARLYHPDRLASYELPEEVKDYVRAMLVRINLAFEQIGQGSSLTP